MSTLLHSVPLLFHSSLYSSHSSNKIRISKINSGVGTFAFSCSFPFLQFMHVSLPLYVTNVHMGNVTILQIKNKAGLKCPPSILQSHLQVVKLKGVCTHAHYFCYFEERTKFLEEDKV